MDPDEIIRQLYEGMKDVPEKMAKNERLRKWISEYESAGELIEGQITRGRYHSKNQRAYDKKMKAVQKDIRKKALEKAIKIALKEAVHE